MTSTNQPLPHDLEAERASIGSVLLDNSCLAVVREVVGSGEFYSPDLATVFAAVGELIEAGEPADLVTVADRLREAGDLERVGGVDCLTTILEAVP